MKKLTLLALFSFAACYADSSFIVNNEELRIQKINTTFQDFSEGGLADGRVTITGLDVEIVSGDIHLLLSMVKEGGFARGEVIPLPLTETQISNSSLTYNCEGCAEHPLFPLNFNGTLTVGDSLINRPMTLELFAADSPTDGSEPFTIEVSSKF